jgi:cell pole-organizing protein PopZ
MSPANPKPQEPSMEEILASIRRIIADDQDGGKAPPTEEDPFEQAMSDALGPDELGSEDGDDAGEELEASEEDEDDILDLADVGAPVASPAASSLDLDHEDISFRDEDGQIDFDSLGMDEDEEEEAVEAAEELLADSFDDEPEMEPEPQYAPAPSYQPSAMSTSAHQFLDEERLISQATDAAVGNAFNALAHTVLANNGRTLDDLVKEMLRPMLKVWLDDNLPTIVERLVRSEIERVSRGGR